MALPAHDGRGGTLTGGDQGLMATFALEMIGACQRNRVGSRGGLMAIGTGLTILFDGIVAQGVKIMVAAIAVELVGMAGMGERHSRSLEPGWIPRGKHHFILLGRQGHACGDQACGR